MSLKRLSILACVFSSAVYCQTSTSTIQGIVRDSSNAVVPQVNIAVKNAQTGVTSKVQTNSEGYFQQPFLQPGVYEVMAEKTGFERFNQTAIRLEVQQTLSLAISLSVGSTTQSVDVLGAPPPLATTTSTVSTNNDNRKIVDMPLNGRNVMTLAMLVPGVVLLGGGGNQPQWYSPSIGGGRTATSDVLVDGASLSVTDPTGGTEAYGGNPPSVDAVEEFSVQINNLAAEYGRTGGGIINVATKQGTNQLRGTAREFLRNSALDANNFFSNRAGVPLSSFKQNQFGFSLGGPVLLPRVYDGRNRTFFFFDMERRIARSPAVQNTTVPTTAWKIGNFSGLKNGSGQDIAIYDPLTIQQVSGSTYVRLPFPGNQVPLGRFDKVASNEAKIYPEPNTVSSNPYTPVNNYYVTRTNSADVNNISIRGDHDMSGKWRTYARFNRYAETNAAVNYWGNAATGGASNPIRRYAIVWDNTITLTPTTILNARYGVSRFSNPSIPVNAGFDSTTLGFPKYLNQQAGLDSTYGQVPPPISISGLAGIPGGGGRRYVPTAHNVSTSITKVVSKHSFKAGYEYRKFFLNFWQSTGASNGSFGFGANWTQADPNIAKTTEGFGFASFLLGLGSGSQSNAPVQAVSSTYHGAFLQDDYRLTPRLTLNLGLRYEVDIPRTERYNRMSYFDLSAPSPITGKVAGFPNLVGAMMFTNADHRQQTPTDTNNIGPRIGFAYQVNTKTVVRGGYALMYGTSRMQAAYHGAGFEGYRTGTSMITSIDGRTPLNYLSNPFPDGFQQPLGPAAGPYSGPYTNLGKTVSESWFPDYVNAVVQQWNLTVQRELPGGMVVEAGYVANKGNHLQDGGALYYNQLDPKYMALGASLSDQVPNPFYNIIADPTSTLSRATVARSQLLSPYPQYTGLNPVQPPVANSLYHSMTLRVQKRLSHGMSLLAAYTTGKTMSDGEFGGFYSDGGSTLRQNVYDRKSDRSLDSQDVAQRLALSVNYDFPIGRGRALLGGANRVIDAAIGGWQVNVMATFQSGLPIPIFQAFNNTGLGNGGQRPNSTGQSARITGGTTDQRLQQWFNVSAFTTSAPYTFGNAPRTLPDCREPGLRNFDMSLFKSFTLVAERLKAQLRLEAFNAMNTPQFDRANSTIGSPAAGTISALRVSPRQVQLALKLIF